MHEIAPCSLYAVPETTRAATPRARYKKGRRATSLPTSPAILCRELVVMLGYWRSVSDRRFVAIDIGPEANKLVEQILTGMELRAAGCPQKPEMAPRSTRSSAHPRWQTL